LETGRRKNANFQNLLIFIVLMILAFGIGYGLGYLKLMTAEKEWTRPRLSCSPNRESGKRIGPGQGPGSALGYIRCPLSGPHPYFREELGLAAKALESLKETFTAIQRI